MINCGISTILCLFLTVFSVPAYAQRTVSVTLTEASVYGGLRTPSMIDRLCEWELVRVTRKDELPRRTLGPKKIIGSLPFNISMCHPNPLCCDDDPGNDHGPSISITDQVQARDTRSFSGSIAGSITVTASGEVGGGQLVPFKLASSVARTVTEQFGYSRELSLVNSFSATINVPPCWVSRGKFEKYSYPSARVTMAHTYKAEWIALGDPYFDQPCEGETIETLGGAVTTVRATAWDNLSATPVFSVNRRCNPDNRQDCPCQEEG